MRADPAGGGGRGPAAGRWPAWLPPAGLFAAIWLLAHPYTGLTHDARLYGLQALARIDAALGADLFLVHGSQSAFTIFPAIHAALIRLLGLEAANIGLVLLGHGLWIGGAALLARRLARGPAAWLIAVAVVVLPGAYGGFGVFSYAEGFASPRLFAEAAALAGLGLLLAGRWPAALALQIPAFAVHPLMALPAVGAIGVYLILGDRRWLLATAGAAGAVLAAAALGVDPAARLFERMDGDWLTVVLDRNTYVFPSRWAPEDWYALAAAAALTGAGAIASGNPRRRLFLAVLATAAAGLGASLVAGDWLRSTLAIQLQPWRATWLLEVASIAGGVLALLRLRRRGPNRWPISALLLVALAHPVLPQLAAIAGGFAMVMLYGELSGRLSAMPRAFRLACFVFAGLCGLLELGLLGYRVLLSAQLLIPAGLFVPADLLDSGLAGLLLALAALRLRRRLSGAADLRACAVAGLVLLAAAAAWDQRSDWRALTEGGGAGPLTAALPAGAQVYWPPNPAESWFLLRRPSYVSSLQGAGVLFHRETALDYRRRLRALAPLGGMHHYPFDAARQTCEDIARPPLPGDMIRSCAAAPDLDYLVLTWRVEAFPHGTWHPPRSNVRMCRTEGDWLMEAPQAYYFYACADLREAGRAAAAADVDGLSRTPR
jgi:hypothetical protein